MGHHGADSRTVAILAVCCFAVSGSGCWTGMCGNDVVARVRSPDGAEVPASNRVLQPLPGCVSLFLFYPGVRFAHPRLSSFRPAGAEFGMTEAVPPF